MGRLLEERRGVRRDVLLGRRLLEVDERLSVLEEKLMVEPSASGQQREVDSEEEEEYEEDDDDEDNDATPAARTAATALTRLRSHAQQYLLLTHLTQKLQDHPFVVAQQSRILRVRNTLLLDLRTAMKQAQKAEVGGGQLLKFVVLYRELGEAEEAIKALKDV